MLSSPELTKDMVPLPGLKDSDFNFHDISSKRYLLDEIVRPIVLYRFEVWGPSLLRVDWDITKRVQALLLKHIIHCKWIVPQPII